MVEGEQRGNWRPGLFILSARDRDGLAQCASQAGWRSIAARRHVGLARRFLASEALVAMVDMRGVPERTEQLAALNDAVVAAGAALIAVIDAEDVAAVPDLVAAGATHYLVAPVTVPALQAVLASALVHVERVGGGVAQARDRQAIYRSDSLGWRLDLATGLVTVSEALARELDLAARPCRVRTLLRIVAGDDRQGMIAAIQTALRRGGPTAFAHALADGMARRVVQHLHPDAGGISGRVEPFPSATARMPEQRDYLTGLRNRAGALAWLDNALLADGGEGMQTLDGEGRPIALLIGISQFDRLNSAYGQFAGDALLSRSARRMERLVDDLAPGDAIVARIAGTTFLVALRHVHADRAIFLAQRLVAEVSKPFSAGDHLIRMTARCGIAEALRGDDAARLLRRAGTALADARASTGEGIRILRRERESQAVDDDRLETDLRLALDRGEIDVVFQPQYATADGRMAGVEALARWQHPHYGMLGAGALFAAAGRSDFMLPLSAHIQSQALRLAAGWPGALSEVRLSINVTAADIAQPDFLADFLARVDGQGFPRGRVTVEITESGLIEDMVSAVQLLDRLREAGLRVAIDDFGTGYSSLAYLKALPLDYLKIDRALAQDIAGSRRDRVIVRGVIQMAKSLGLEVIAEGVETEQQLALLAHEGCDYFQGFLRSAAVDGAELAALAGAGAGAGTER
ncbi:bifunctional diguanylate cyclase/phosphodiesterase [Sphingobium sp. H39-3-25]|uniref:putative bifunctional diguanylate cyclase/phosphodiesterase n=1 Tax=Sphingobium arseniciresistens TaxID=3030834 RepID=UPI0023B92D8B|nr:bifunctional diguanylate cyclase/phosphodiesterase [Sphingobium arseniciresistens]